MLWLPEPQLPATESSLWLSAAFQSGEADVAYGLIVGEEPHYLVTAVSPLGYVAVWEWQHGALFYHLPWQTWPHVQPGRATNEIWIDRQGGEISVRLNREQLWRAEVSLAATEVGLFVQSFGETAVIGFQTLRLFTPE